MDCEDKSVLLQWLVGIQFELQTTSCLMRFTCQILVTWMALEADFEIVTIKLVLPNSSMFVALMIKTALSIVLVEMVFDFCTGKQRW